MSNPLRYAHRAMAAVYLLGWMLACTSSIGRTASEPTTWANAWQAVATIAAGLWLGWQAGRESKAAP